jgi:hypothetical protein
MPLSRRFPGTTRTAGASQPAEVIQLDANGDPVVQNAAVVAAAGVTTVASSATVVTLQAANADRRGLAIYNDGKQKLYVKLGAAASLIDFTVMIDKQEYYELPQPMYVGEVTGIWDSVDGDARVTELTV